MHPTHQSDRGGGGDKVFSHQLRGGSDQFGKSRKHNIVNDGSIISSGRRLLLAAVVDDEQQQAR
jgi:hypothetical protein